MWGGRTPRHERRGEQVPLRFRALFDYRLARGRQVTFDPEYEAAMALLQLDYEDWLRATSRGIR